MDEQVGWRGFVKALRHEAPRYAQLLPELPRLVHRALQPRPAAGESPALLAALLREQRRTSRLLAAVLWIGLGFVIGLLVARLFLRLPP
jgi:ubiquinone biosynthesis protein